MEKTKTKNKSPLVSTFSINKLPIKSIKLQKLMDGNIQIKIQKVNYYKFIENLTNLWEKVITEKLESITIN